jgi:hypothetical protein
MRGMVCARCGGEGARTCVMLLVFRLWPAAVEVVAAAAAVAAVVALDATVVHTQVRAGVAEVVVMHMFSR